MWYLSKSRKKQFLSVLLKPKMSQITSLFL